MKIIKSSFGTQIRFFREKCYKKNKKYIYGFQFKRWTIYFNI